MLHYDVFFLYQCIPILFNLGLSIFITKQEFPIVSKLDPEVYGPPESGFTKELIEEELKGMTVEQVMTLKTLFKFIIGTQGLH